MGPTFISEIYRGREKEGKLKNHYFVGPGRSRVMHLFPGAQDFSEIFGFLPPGPTPIKWLVLLTTRSRVQDWHSGHSKSTLSLEFTKSFSNILPHSRHLNSKMGIILLLLFHTGILAFGTQIGIPHLCSARLQPGRPN
jgi:hypothetical protein